MRREGLVSTACARFSIYFAVKLSVNVKAHNIRTYSDSADFAECSHMRMQSIPCRPSLRKIEGLGTRLIPLLCCC